MEGVFTTITRHERFIEVLEGSTLGSESVLLHIDNGGIVVGLEMIKHGIVEGDSGTINLKHRAISIIIHYVFKERIFIYNKSGTRHIEQETSDIGHSTARYSQERLIDDADLVETRVILILIVVCDITHYDVY